MNFPKDRRSVSRYVIDFRAQLRFLFPFAASLVLSLGFISVLFWDLTLMRGQVNLAHGLKNQMLAAMADNIMDQAVLVSLVGIVILCIATVIFWLIYTHRIFGPQVPILRHIRRLVDGNYESEIQLRKHDEYVEVARELNRLAAALRTKSGS